MVIITAICSMRLPAQTDGNTAASITAAASSWSFSASISGYWVPNGQSYVSPTFSGDHGTLHLEARYDYEAQQTGSLWAGYNLKTGRKVVLLATPMVGGAFGKVNGVAPGLELTVTYKTVQLYSANEYIFATNTKTDNFFYTWTQLTYSPVQWLTVGYVVQRTRAYHTPLDIQRGPMVGFTHKKLNFTTAIFNIGETDPTVDFSVGYNF
jgi:hypothetical protein